MKEERERFPFIAAIEHPSTEDLRDHENKYRYFTVSHHGHLIGN